MPNRWLFSLLVCCLALGCSEGSELLSDPEGGREGETFDAGAPDGDVDSGPVDRLLDQDHSFRLLAFSADGRQLAFLRDLTDGVLGTLFLYDVTRGDRVQIDERVVTVFADVSIAPDGSWVLYRRAPDSNEDFSYVNDLYLWRAGQGAPERIGERVLRNAARVSPDGNTVLYVTDRALHARDLTRGVDTLLSEAVVASPYLSTDEMIPVSPDGRWAAYLADRPVALAVVDLETLHATRFETRAVLRTIRFDSRSRLLAVVGDAAGTHLERRDLTAGTPPATTRGGGPNNPSFATTEDGRFVAYPVDGRLSWEDLDTGRSGPVADDVDFQQYRFVAGTNRLVYATHRDPRDASGELFALDLETGNTADLGGGRSLGEPSLGAVVSAPDGDRLAFHPAGVCDLIAYAFSSDRSETIGRGCKLEFVDGGRSLLYGTDAVRGTPLWLHRFGLPGPDVQLTTGPIAWWFTSPNGTKGAAITDRPGSGWRSVTAADWVSGTRRELSPSEGGVGDVVVSNTHIAYLISAYGHDGLYLSLLP